MWPFVRLMGSLPSQAHRANGREMSMPLYACMVYAPRLTLQTSQAVYPISEMIKFLVV